MTSETHGPVALMTGAGEVFDIAGTLKHHTTAQSTLFNVQGGEGPKKGRAEVTERASGSPIDPSSIALWKSDGEMDACTLLFATVQAAKGPASHSAESPRESRGHDPATTKGEPRNRGSNGHGLESHSQGVLLHLEHTPGYFRSVTVAKSTLA